MCGSMLWCRCGILRTPWHHFFPSTFTRLWGPHPVRRLVQKTPFSIVTSCYPSPCSLFKISFYSKAQAGLELIEFLLLQPVKCWNYSHEPPALSDFDTTLVTVAWAFIDLGCGVGEKIQEADKVHGKDATREEHWSLSSQPRNTEPQTCLRRGAMHSCLLGPKGLF